MFRRVVVAVALLAVVVAGKEYTCGRYTPLRHFTSPLSYQWVAKTAALDTLHPYAVFAHGCTHEQLYVEHSNAAGGYYQAATQRFDDVRDAAARAAAFSPVRVVEGTREVAMPLDAPAFVAQRRFTAAYADDGRVVEWRQFCDKVDKDDQAQVLTFAYDAHQRLESIEMFRPDACFDEASERTHWRTDYTYNDTALEQWDDALGERPMSLEVTNLETGRVDATGAFEYTRVEASSPFSDARAVYFSYTFDDDHATHPAESGSWTETLTRSTDGFDEATSVRLMSSASTVTDYCAEQYWCQWSVMPYLSDDTPTAASLFYDLDARFHRLDILTPVNDRDLRQRYHGDLDGTLKTLETVEELFPARVGYAATDAERVFTACQTRCEESRVPAPPTAERVSVENVCRGAWRFANANMWPVAVQYSHAEDAATTSTNPQTVTIDGHSSAIVYANGGKRLRAWMNATLLLDSGSGAAPNGGGAAGLKCLDLVPQCNGKYIVRNPLSYEQHFTFSAYNSDTRTTTTDAGTLAAHGSMWIDTPGGGSRELASLYANGELQSDRKRGNARDCAEHDDAHFIPGFAHTHNHYGNGIGGEPLMV